MFLKFKDLTVLLLSRSFGLIIYDIAAKFNGIMFLVMRLFFYSAVDLKAIVDSQSFLFTLVNPSGNELVKISQNKDTRIRCKSGLGPSFGTTQCYDLQVWNDANSNLDLGFGFKCPENVDKKTYFAGKNPFTVSELEVFKVNL